MHLRSHLGKIAELKTADYLLQKGFAILAHNYRKKNGEIDIIAIRHKLLVFVEVKMRRHHYFDLSDVITSGKKRKIMAVAKDFIARNGWQDRSYRFDVALLHEKADDLELSYIENAFNEGDCTW